MSIARELKQSLAQLEQYLVTFEKAIRKAQPKSTPPDARWKSYVGKKDAWWNQLQELIAATLHELTPPGDDNDWESHQELP